jgi:hypothetical protein
MGVEGSGAVSGSEETVKRVKKESIGVFRGSWFGSELLCSLSFDWGLLDRMSSVSLSFIRFMLVVDFRHRRFRKNCQEGKDNNTLRHV